MEPIGASSRYGAGHRDREGDAANIRSSIAKAAASLSMN